MTKLLSRAAQPMKDFFAACSRKQKLFCGGTLLAAFTSTLFASSAVVATENASLSSLAQLLNLALTSGILLYAIRLEHRLTKIETTIAIKLPQ